MQCLWCQSTVADAIYELGSIVYAWQSAYSLVSMNATELLGNLGAEQSV